MSPLTAFDRGAWKARRARRFAFLFWFSYTVLGAIAIAPLAAVAAGPTSRSTWSSALLRDFDIAWVAEFFSTNLEPLPILLPALGILFLFVLLTPFLSGALLAILNSGDPRYPLHGFFASGAKFYWRLFRLALMSLLFYGVALWLAGLVDRLAGGIWGKGMLGGPLHYAAGLKNALSLLFCVFLSVLFDYARIRIVAGGQRSAWGATLWALRFVLNRFSWPAAFWLLLTLASVLFFAAYLGLRALVPSTSVLLLLLLQQLSIGSRIWIRFVNWGGALEIYHAAEENARPAGARHTPSCLALPETL